MARNSKPTRVGRIMQARERVDVAADHLAQLDSVDPRFEGSLAEWRAALQARAEAEAV